MATPGVVAEPHAVSQPGRPGGAYHLAAPYLRSTLKLVTGAGLLFLVYMWCQYFWYEGFEKIYGASMARLGLVYTYGAGLDPPVKSLDMYDSFYILFLWVPLGGGALFMILAQRLPNQAKPGWMRRTQALVRRKGAQATRTDEGCTPHPQYMALVMQHLCNSSAIPEAE